MAGNDKKAQMASGQAFTVMRSGVSREEIAGYIVEQEVEARKYQALRAALQNPARRGQLYCAIRDKESDAAIAGLIGSNDTLHEMRGLLAEAATRQSSLDFVARLFGAPRELSAPEKAEALYLLHEHGSTGRCTPVIPFLLGRRNQIDDRSKGISWSLATIDLTELWICRVNDAIDEVLKPNGMNLSQSWSEQASHVFGLDPRRVPDEASRLLCLQRTKDGMNGRLQLLDGFHRGMAMIREGRTTTEAYVGLRQC